MRSPPPRPQRFAKLPAPDDATKAKAAEAAAKAAWQSKVDAWQLCKAQDRIAAKFGSKGQGAKAPAAAVKTAAAPASAASTASAAGDKPTPVPPPARRRRRAPIRARSPTTRRSRHRWRASGAHSPAGNAVSPPSVRAESGTMAPAKK